MTLHTSFAGEVVSGHRRGHVLGFPTANIASIVAGTLPPDGVYSALVFLPHLGKTYGATVSMGWNQTFDDVLEHRVEAHLHDFAGTIYGCRIEVRTVALLRDMRRFADAVELARQIAADVETSRAILAEPLAALAADEDTLPVFSSLS